MTCATLAAMEISLFVPCFINQLFPEAGMAGFDVLERLGFSPRVTQAHCCGQVLSNAGDGPGAQALFKRWAQQHSQDEETVVILSASCTEHLRNEIEAAPKRAQIFEFCDFLVRFGPESYPTAVPKTLLLHTSCSAQHGRAGARTQRSLLDRISKLRVLEPQGPEGECCGFGGSFATTFPELSGSMGKDRIAYLQSAIPKKGDTPFLTPDALVSADLSCLLHLGTLRSYPGWPILHPAQILWEALQ